MATKSTGLGGATSTRAARRSQGSGVAAVVTATDAPDVDAAAPAEAEVASPVVEARSTPTPADAAREADPVAAPAKAAPRSRATAVAPRGGRLQKKTKQPPKVSLGTKLDQSTHKRLTWFSHQEEFQIIDIVGDALDEFLDRHGVPQADDLP